MREFSLQLRWSSQRTGTYHTATQRVKVWTASKFSARDRKKFDQLWLVTHGIFIINGREKMSPVFGKRVECHLGMFRVHYHCIVRIIASTNKNKIITDHVAVGPLPFTATPVMRKQGRFSDEADPRCETFSLEGRWGGAVAHDVDDYNLTMITWPKHRELFLCSPKAWDFRISAHYWCVKVVDWIYVSWYFFLWQWHQVALIVGRYLRQYGPDAHVLWQRCR